MAFACYITPTEFYAAHDLGQWIPPDECEQKLRNAASYVANDLRSRGVDTSRLMPPTMLVGSNPYEFVTSAANETKSTVSAGNVSRLVIRCTTESFAKFGLEGSPDKTTWFTIPDLLTGNDLEVQVQGEGVESKRFFEKYPYYRLTVTTDESVTYSAFLVDTSMDELITWKAIENAMFLALDIDTRSQQLYDASRVKYEELASSVHAQYDADGDNVTDSEEITMQRRTVFYR